MGRPPLRWGPVLSCPCPTTKSRTMRRTQLSRPHEDGPLRAGCSGKLGSSRLRRPVREIGVNASGSNDEYVKREAADRPGKRCQCGGAVRRPCDTKGEERLANSHGTDIVGERASASEVVEQHVVGGGRTRQRQTVEECGGPRCRICPERQGREGDESCYAEQDEIPKDGQSVHWVHEAEERMMILPQ
jgi:hypothetical protein